MTHRFSNSNPRSRPARLESDMFRLQRTMVGGVALTPQGFAWPSEEKDLHAQCAELNRQALMPSPETLAGKSMRDLFGRAHD